MTRTITLGNIEQAEQAWGYTFQFKYFIGYCKKRGRGTGPTLKIKLGTEEVWKRQLDLKIEDYPYDKRCGAPAAVSKKYSPWQTAYFIIPKNVGGSLTLTLIGTDRNIHVLGNGLQCSGKLVGET